MKRLVALITLAFAVQAHAGLFDDNVARQQITDLQQDNAKQNTRLNQLEASNKQMLNLLGQIEGLKQEIANLRGQIEVLQFNQDQAGKQQKDLFTDLDNRVRTIEGAKAQQKADAQQASQQSLDDAIKLSQGGKHKDAVAALKQFVTANPADPNVPTAQYWMGNSYAALKDYKNARFAYAEIVNKAPDNALAPDALFGLAVCANAQGNKKEARSFLLQLVEKYPQSEKAATAKKALLSVN
ncbi:tetratricopeptide repeat protein [Jeongeupia naejangsanensis]|uniref:Cell division coordinator CpoB n=1 Tax=Jeongeupia naejangsanensis TaxID=613195 RepID=A0ABS2BM90_9NEIS|nr:tetratricopeptide repeat protein [Jeongeupia naejangsanensis]MBM3116560.1 tetratricopeptide repeat protein [Jeongeupia naejangsanensis]